MKATITVTLAVLLDLLWASLFSHVSHLGFGTSLYWSLGAASTEGSSIPELTGAEQLLKCLMIITDLPFVLGTYALYQSWEAADTINEHIKAAESRIKTHIEGREAEFKTHMESTFQRYLGKGNEHEQQGQDPARQPAASPVDG